MFGWLRRRADMPPRLRAAVVAVALLAGLGFVGYEAGAYLLHRYARRAIADALYRRDFAAARGWLDRCIWWSPGNPEWRLLAARTARRAGDFEEADRHLDRCDRLGADPRLVALERAMRTAQSGNPGPVEFYLRASLAEGGVEADLILEALAVGYLDTRRLPEALDCVDRLLELRPDDAQALLWRGQVLEWLNLVDEAVAAYRRAVARHPDHPKARRLLALALIRLDLAEEAIPLLEAAYADSPDPEVGLGLARAHRCLGRLKEAGRLLEAVLGDEPNNAEALTEQGKLALQTGRPAEAEAPLRQALRLAPFDREARYCYYLCLQQQGREVEAARAREEVERIRADLQRVSDLRRQVMASPRDASLRSQIGTIFLRNGQEREGLRWLQSALQLDPDHHEARRTLAQHARQKQDPPPKEPRQ